MTMKRKKVSIIVPFETMKDNIRHGEHWVRTDWTKGDKYVILADERYVDVPCLLLVFRDSDDHVIFRPTYNDFKYRWKKIDG